MKRRTAAVSVLVLGCTPLAVAQSERLRKIGILVPTPGDSTRYASFLAALRKLGWNEGQNLALEWRYVEAKYDRVTAMTQELINAGAEVIVTNSTPAVVNAKKASSTVPIVAAAFGDPVASGLVASLAAPGGNVTGVSIIFDGILDKVFELSSTLLPRMARVAILYNPQNQASVPAAQRLESLARTAGVSPRKVEASNALELDGALQAIATARSEAVLVPVDPFMFGQRQTIADFCLQRKLVAVGQSSEFVAAGFLASYGPDFNASFATAASFVSRILRGAKPADLPVEQVTKLELAVNLKTARALGLKVPQALLLRADEVIQ